MATGTQLHGLQKKLVLIPKSRILQLSQMSDTREILNYQCYDKNKTQEQLNTLGLNFWNCEGTSLILGGGTGVYYGDNMLPNRCPADYSNNTDEQVTCIDTR